MDHLRPIPAPLAARQAADAFADGARRQAEGDEAGAEACFQEALARHPDMAQAWSNLGLLAEARGRLDEAQAHYERALALDPALYPAWMNLATLLGERHRFDEAEAHFRRALQLQPDDPAAWSNLGAMLTCMRREDDAQACLLHALRLAPDHEKARFNLGYLWMRQGRLADGALCNESRPYPAVLQARLGRPRWAGEPLAGRSVLLVTDAAHGDLLHMARYVPVLKALGARQVGIWGLPALARCLRRMSALDAFIPLAQPVLPEEWDTWAPLMSLPHLCGTTLETIPAALPYLRPDPARVAVRGAQGLARRPGDALRVGLVWRGNPGHENDAHRSLPSLAALAPLWRVPGVAFVSLQSGAGSEEALAPPPGQPLLTLREPLGDFDETAAVVANLDLVIGVDTSMVHLAGALGKPVWVLLSDHKTDWRWFSGREDSPWYPGVMRLFRQDAARTWAPVIDQVAQALATWAAGAVTDAGMADAASTCV